MASFFPGGQDSFTPKVDLVDTVLASHVNDLQNAVASLEIGGVSKQNIAYAASITPNVPAGEYVIVGTLTGNITINAPTNALTGRRLTFRFTQDGTGGRTVTWNAVFKVTNWTVNTGANAVTEATFTYDGTNWFLALNPASIGPTGTASGPPLSGTFAIGDAREDLAGAIHVATRAGIAGSYSATVLADNPVAYWRLDDTGATVADQKATYPGTPAGGVTRGIVGTLPDRNTAMQFDGTTGYIRAAGALTLSGDFSLECWVKRGAATSNPVVLHIGTPANWAATNTLLLYVGDSGSGANAARLYINGSNVSKGTNTQVTDNLWHHVVVTRSGTTITMYLDGAQLGTTGVLAGSVTATEMNLGAGNQNGTPTQFFPGVLDEMAVYTTALSAGQISTHYSIGAGALFVTASTASAVASSVAVPAAGTTLTGGTWGGNLTDAGGMVWNANHPKYRAIGTWDPVAGTGDARPAVQQAITDAAGGTVFFLGTFLLATTTTSFGSTCNLGITASGTTLMGAGAGASHLIQATTPTWLFVLNNAANSIESLTLYPFADAVRGARQVTMTTASDATRWAAGDVIYLTNGIVGAVRDAELNVVTSVNGGTGVVTLKWPLAKPQTNDFVHSTGAANANSVTMQNTTITGLHLKSLAGLCAAHQLLGFRLTDNSIETARASNEQTDLNMHRLVRWLRNDWYINATAAQGVEFGRGSMDILIAENSIAMNPANTGNNVLIFGEGPARVTVRHNQLSCPGDVASTIGAVMFGEVWGGIAEGNFISQGTASATGGVVQDNVGSISHELEIRDNEIEVGGSFSGVIQHNDGTVVEGNRIRTAGTGVWMNNTQSGARGWCLGNRITMLTGSTQAVYLGGSTNHDVMVMGNSCVVESGSPTHAIVVLNDGAATKSPTIIANYAKGFTNGLTVTSVANDPTMYVLGNDFSGCTTPYNPTNPMGGVVAITPGASPYTYTAGATSREMVYIDGGTVTTVVKNGITLYNFAAAAARCAVLLAQKEAVVVTYTVAPVMNKDRVA